MPESATLEIRFRDEAAMSSSSSILPPSQASPLSGSAPTSSGNYQGGSPPTPPGKSFAEIVKPLSAIAAAMTTMQRFMQVGTAYGAGISSARARFTNDQDVLSKEAAETAATTQAIGGTVSGVASAGYVAAGALFATGFGAPLAAGVAAFSLAVDKLGGIVETWGNGQKQADDNFRMLDSAMRERLRVLSGYSPTIAGGLGRQDTQKMQADIAQARFLGPDFQKLIDRQTELDRLKQITGTVTQRDQILQATEETNKRIAEMNKKLEEMLNSSNESTRLLARALAKSKPETPMDEFLKGIQIPVDDRRADQTNRDLRILRDQEANNFGPLLGN